MPNDIRYADETVDPLAAMLFGRYVEASIAAMDSITSGRHLPTGRCGADYAEALSELGYEPYDLPMPSDCDEASFLAANPPPPGKLVARAFRSSGDLLLYRLEDGCS